MEPIYSYDDYRKFLSDFYQEQKTKRRGFTFRRFAEKAGLASGMHLKLVMSGRRNLTHKTIAKFAAGLELKRREFSYFENLVYFSQAKDTEEKARFWAKLNRLRRVAQTPLLGTSQQACLLSEPYFPALYECVQLRDFREDPEWISKKLKRMAGASEIRRGLVKLEECGLLTRDEQGNLRQASAPVRTGDEIENLLLRRQYRDMMTAAMKKIDEPLDQREFGFVTVCTTEEQFQKLKAQIKDFILQTNLRTSVKAGEGEVVCQMNLQLFKMT